MKKFTALLLGSMLMLGTAACDQAKTSSDAPNNQNGDTNNAENVKPTKSDGVNEVRRDQINSDIRAREQRNDIGGDQNVRDDSDLESQVRGKLEANIPRSKLTVDAEKGAVAISGTVPSQDEYDKIQPLAKEIKGVNAVKMNVKVAPATEQ